MKKIEKDSYLVGSGILMPKCKGDESVFGELPTWCEEFNVSDDRQWSFKAFFTDRENRVLADGDMEDLLAQNFPTLIELKRYQGAEFEAHIVVGGPHSEMFHLDDSTISMLAVLGANVFISSET